MIHQCEVCLNDNLQNILDLGNHPLCDDLIPVGSSEVSTEYPIIILFCPNCKTALQKVNVQKQELFSDTYHYRSRFTADVLDGMQDLVASISARIGKLNNKTVLDVGCNDGSLLDVFASKGCVTVGVEPTGAVEDADSDTHRLYKNYFDDKTAQKILDEIGSPDIITFTNVFAHIEDFQSLMGALKMLISDSTLLVIENHYLGSVIDRNQFDTFYHEHPRTYSLTSFLEISKRLNCPLVDVQFPKRYGGNIRVMLSGNEAIVNTNVSTSVSTLEYTAKEGDFERDLIKMKDFIDTWRHDKMLEIEKLVQIHGKLPAKAFPGRAAILVKLLNLNEDHISAVYEKPGSMKIGHYVPGTRIPIRSDTELFEKNVPVIINFAWHIQSEIKSYLKRNGTMSEVIDLL